MDIWGVEPCRACLHHEDATTMYSLRVPETLKLFKECSNSNISLTTPPSEKTPKYLCSMCYRLCELWQTFRKRCQETEQKLNFDPPEVVPEETVPTKTVPKQEQEDEWEDYSDESQDIHMDPLAEEDSSHSAKDEPVTMNSSSEPAMTISELCLCDRPLKNRPILRLRPCHHLIHSSCWEDYALGEEDMPCPYCGGLLVDHSPVERKKYKKHNLEDRRKILERARAGECFLELARELGVKRNTAESWVRLGRDLPLPKGGNRSTLLKETHVERLMQYLRQNPKCTLKELQQWATLELGIRASEDTIKRCLKTHLQKSGQDKESGHPSQLIKKCRPKVNVPENLIWGPGPNELGVWKHFLRDSSKTYVKCLWPDCTTILHCPNGTGVMRKHVAHRHSTSIPLKRLDSSGGLVEWEAFQ